jgi:hypothetical protein
MDAKTDLQGIVNQDQPAAVASAGTVQHALLRLQRWQPLIQQRLRSQMTLLGAMETYVLTELRIHVPNGNIDKHFVTSLVNGVLQQIIDGKPLVYRPMQDAPYRWPGGGDLALPVERRETVIKSVAAVAAYFVEQYRNYLRDHWEIAGLDAELVRLLARKLKRSIASIDRTFAPERLTALKVDQLRNRLEKLQQIHARRFGVTAMVTSRERLQLETVSFAQLPHWLRVLNVPDQDRLRKYQGQVERAWALVDDLLEGFGSLLQYARREAMQYIRLKLDMEVEPDSIQIKLQWQTAVGQPVVTRSLSELMAAGPLSRSVVSVIDAGSDLSLRNHPLDSKFIADMLLSQDYPAQYLDALTQQCRRGDWHDALRDWFTLRLQHSAFVARCAGHMTVSDHERLERLWSNEAGGQPSTDLRVAGVILPNGKRCSELLVFYRQSSTGDNDDLLLYAPNKPDGQEWVRLPSLRELNAELGGWIASEAGREYLLQQLSASDRQGAREIFIRVVARSDLWDLNCDLRRPAASFSECLRDVVKTGLANKLVQVEREDSPVWYSALVSGERASVSSLNQELLVHQQVFNELLAGYEVFIDFAKRTVADRIAFYLREKGVLEPVDPATVMIDYSPKIFDGTLLEASLLDLAIHGYDDNSGIEHPKRGVRSTVGQNLSQLRSAELVSSVRSAYLGEKYEAKIRGEFLDAQAASYAERRQAYQNLLLTKMERDLRVARGKAQVSAEAYLLLLEQITLLRTPQELTKSASSVTKLLESEGLIRFTVRGEIVLGVYVFALTKPESARWLYTPDAPDNIAFRDYQSLWGEAAAHLHDYILARVANSVREKVENSLRSMAARLMAVDQLFENQRVTDVRDEFNNFIGRSISEVLDITTSRAEMIRQQVLKGLLYASALLCLVYPPFAVLLDVTFFALSAEKAINAHREGDTEGALGHWLEASWGALLGVVGGAGAGKVFARAITSLRHTPRPVSLMARRLKSTAPVAVTQGSPVRTAPALALEKIQAVKKTPQNLQEVVEEGIFHGTWRSPASASQPQATYYIRSKGRYYQVKKDPHFDGLCQIDASRPAALYNPPVSLSPSGRGVQGRVGLRGGNGNVLNLGRVQRLSDAFPDSIEPNAIRGAFQGEAVVAKLSAEAGGNYLFSLNAQTCVIASLYNPATKFGAVIHFDHNIKKLIEAAVQDLIRRMDGAAKDIRCTLVGGDWLMSGADIGGAVRSVMRQKGLQPTWDYWSYSSCLGNTYGVSLNLKTGVSTVFKHTRDQLAGFYNPIHQAAAKGIDPLSRRAMQFQRRYRQKPLHEDAGQRVVDQNNLEAKPESVREHDFRITAL